MFDTTIRQDKFPCLFFLVQNWGSWRIGNGRNFFYFFWKEWCFLAKAITKRELQQYLLRKTFLKLTTAQQKLGLLRVNCSWLFFKSNFNLWYKKWASDYSKWVYLYREASWWIKNNNNKHVGLRIFCEQTLQQKLGELVWQPHCKSTTKNLSFLTETRVQRRFFLLMFSVQAILFLFFTSLGLPKTKGQKKYSVFS